MEKAESMFKEFQVIIFYLTKSSNWFHSLNLGKATMFEYRNKNDFSYFIMKDYFPLNTQKLLKLWQ